MDKRAKKPVAAVLVIFLAVLVFVAGCFLVFYFKKDQIKEFLLSEAYKLQNGEVIIGDIHLDLFSHLSGVTIRIDDLIFYEHPPETRPEGTPPMVEAGQLLVSFHPWQLFNGILDVREAALVDGQVNLVFYDDYTFNILRAIGIQPRKKDPAQLKAGVDEPFELALGLDAIKLRNLEILVEHRPTELRVDLNAIDVDAVFNYNKPIHEVLCAGDFEVIGFTVNGKPYPKPKDLTLDLDFWIDEQSKDGKINPSKVLVEGLTLDVRGNFNISPDSISLNAAFDASNQDWTIMSWLVEENVLNRNPDFLKSGDIYLKGNIELGKGPIGLEVQFGAKNIDLATPEGMESIEGLNFKGWFKSGDSSDFSQAELVVEDLSAVLPGGHINSSFRAESFTFPKIDFRCDLQTDVTGYDQIFKLGLDSVSGLLAVRSDFAIQLNPQNPAEVIYAGSLDIKMNDLNFKLMESNRHINDLAGNFQIVDSILSFWDVSFVTGESDLHIEGYISNLIPYFLGKSTTIKSNLGVRSNSLHLTDFTDSVQYIGPTHLANLDLDFGWATDYESLGDFRIFPSGQLEVHQLKTDLLDFPDIIQMEGNLGFLEDSAAFDINVDRLDLVTSAGTLELSQSSLKLTENSSWFEITTKIYFRKSK